MLFCFTTISPPRVLYGSHICDTRCWRGENIVLSAIGQLSGVQGMSICQGYDKVSFQKFSLGKCSLIDVSFTLPVARGPHHEKVPINCRACYLHNSCLLTSEHMVSTKKKCVSSGEKVIIRRESLKKLLSFKCKWC